MARILFIDDDTKFAEAMATYLSWYELEVRLLCDSTKVVPHLKKDRYDLVICSVSVGPINCYLLCESIRKSDEPKVRQTAIMLVASEELELDRRLLLAKFDVYFMNKYESTGTWFEKIDTILRKKETL